MNAKPNYNNWHIEVDPKRAGDFGGISIGSMEYDKKEAEDLQEEMMSSIKRHVDRVGSTSIVYESYFCGECENCFNTKKEANECCKEEQEIPQFKGTMEALNKLTNL